MHSVPPWQLGRQHDAASSRRLWVRKPCPLVNCEFHKTRSYTDHHSFIIEIRWRGLSRFGDFAVFLQPKCMLYGRYWWQRELSTAGSVHPGDWTTQYHLTWNISTADYVYFYFILLKLCVFPKTHSIFIELYLYTLYKRIRDKYNGSKCWKLSEPTTVCVPSKSGEHEAQTGIILGVNELFWF